MAENPSFATLRTPVHFFALGFGAGLVPKGPGTAGTLLAVVPAWLMQPLPMIVRAGIVILSFALGVWICGESARRLGKHDHSAIVWDEIVAFLGVSLMLPPAPVWWALAFVLFRFFDIAKPWPIRDVDHRLSGGLGIMLDDLVAAVFTVVCLVFVRSFVP